MNNHAFPRNFVGLITNFLLNFLHSLITILNNRNSRLLKSLVLKINTLCSLKITGEKKKFRFRRGKIRKQK